MGKTQSKRYRQCLEKIPDQPLGVTEAVNVIKEFPATKFDATVELVMHLGIDAKQADQALRGAVSLPNGIGATRKVIVFCADSDVDAAKEAGAIEAGCEELVKKVSDGWMDFDVAIATKAVMRDVSKLGRVLGPQGKMPSPKAGTVVDDVTSAVKEYAAGKVEYRNDDGGNLHVPVGKASFDADQLAGNVEFFIDFVRKSKPASVKGVYIKKVSLSATMTPSVQVAV